MLDSTTLKRAAFAAVMAILFAAILLHDYSITKAPIDPRNNAVLVAQYAADSDAQVIDGAVSTKPTFASTWSWWYSSWTREYQYWRPISIQAFWAERHLLGNDYGGWFIVSLAGSIVFLVLAATLAWTLTRSRWLTALTMALYALPFWVPWPWAWMTAKPGADAVLIAWKDQPDIWADTFIVLAMLAAARSRYYLALLAGALAVACKESGYLAFPLILAVVVYQGRWRNLSVLHYFAGTCTLCGLAAIRIMALPGGTYHQGINYDWLIRYTNAIDGIPGGAFLGVPAAFAFGVGAFIAWRLRARSLLLSILPMIAGLLIGAAIEAARNGVPYSVGVVMSLDPKCEVLPATILLTCWLIAAESVCRDALARRVAILAALSSYALAAIFAAGPQVGYHALHLCQLFESLFGACLLLATGRAVLLVRVPTWLRRRQTAVVRWQQPEAEPIPLTHPARQRMSGYRS